MPKMSFVTLRLPWPSAPPKQEDIMHFVYRRITKENNLSCVKDHSLRQRRGHLVSIDCTIHVLPLLCSSQHSQWQNMRIHSQNWSSRARRPSWTAKSHHACKQSNDEKNALEIISSLHTKGTLPAAAKTDGLHRYMRKSCARTLRARLPSQQRL
eukprot:6203231-Pleurochrysis_carterae.AAC.2